MRRELGYSMALHVLVILLGAIGLPYFASEPPELTERILIVDLSKVQVGPKTSLPKANAIGKPKGEDKPIEKKAEPVKPEPPKPEPPKPEPPKPVAPKPEPPKPAPPKPEAPKAAVVDEPKKPDSKKSEPKKPDDKKTAKATEKPEQVQKPVPKKTSEPAPSFDDLMASVNKMRKEAPPPNQDKGKASGTKDGIPGAVDAAAISKDREGFGDTLTLSEMDMIRAQIERHWNVDPGKAGALDMVIEIAVTFESTGDVRTAKIVDQGRLARDPVFRSLAESALRAVFMASPVQAPQKKYEVWRDVRLFFRPQDRL